MLWPVADVLNQGVTVNSEPQTNSGNSFDVEQTATAGSHCGLQQPLMEQLELDWFSAFASGPTETAERNFAELPLQQPLPEPLDTQASDAPPATNSPNSSSTEAEVVPEQPHPDRIALLEQALDQCQAYIYELKLQLADQVFLETQLAATEEAAQIQQQAILSLKTQLSEQEAWVAQAEAIQDKNHQLEQELEDLLGLRETMQQQLQALASQMAIAENLTVQQDQELAKAHAKIDHLQAELSNHQLAIADLETRLQRTKMAISGQQEIISALQHTQGGDSSKNKVIQGLSKNLLNAQIKIEQLEADAANQIILQAQLQHSYQELETQTTHYQERVSQLEQQVAEMQEQILQQAQQASEYETGVQHWKDRSASAEQTVLHLKAVLEQLLIERQTGEPIPESFSRALKDNLANLANAAQLGDAEPSRLLKGLKLDLPGFLHLRRNSKA